MGGRASTPFGQVIAQHMQIAYHSVAHIFSDVFKTTIIKLNPKFFAHAEAYAKRVMVTRTNRQWLDKAAEVDDGPIAVTASAWFDGW